MLGRNNHFAVAVFEVAIARNVVAQRCNGRRVADGNRAARFAIRLIEGSELTGFAHHAAVVTANTPHRNFVTSCRVELRQGDKIAADKNREALFVGHIQLTIFNSVLTVASTLPMKCCRCFGNREGCHSNWTRTVAVVDTDVVHCRGLRNVFVGSRILVKPEESNPFYAADVVDAHRIVLPNSVKAYLSDPL